MNENIEKNKIKSLFREDGNSVCVAADFGFMSTPEDNVYNFPSIIKNIILAKPDGILLSPGQVKNLSNLLNNDNGPAIILRSDWINATRLVSLNKNAKIPSYSLKRITVILPEEAIKLRVDALLSYLLIGYNDVYESENVESVAFLAEKSRISGIPFGIEPVPFGLKINKDNFSKILEYGVKLSIELGADFLKIPYSGTIDSFKNIVKVANNIPLLILGGAKYNDIKDLLQLATDAKIAGARGVVFGRNITMAQDPASILSELSKIYH